VLKLFRDAMVKEGYEPLMLTGETSDSARANFQKRIQDPYDPAWIGLLNMKAGGEAITLDQADDMIMLDLPWTDDEIRQVEDRLHRISRIHNVTVYRLQSRGTVEERIAMLTDQQRKDLMALRPAGKKLLAGILGK
jgi:SNF2 family DNA or RNA helicase